MSPSRVCVGRGEGGRSLAQCMTTVDQGIVAQKKFSSSKMIKNYSWHPRQSLTFPDCLVGQIQKLPFSFLCQKLPFSFL